MLLADADRTSADKGLLDYMYAIADCRNRLASAGARYNFAVLVPSTHSAISQA